ncbi:MAG: spondin domain-containing protein [Betaproteobacteria bacterium]
MHRTTKRALTAALGLAASQALAAGVAVYEVRVERTWSDATHPRDYPGDIAHFSPGIGAAHAPGYRMFAEGGIATPGLETLSQKGKTSPFDMEIAGAQDKGAVGSVFMLAPVRIVGGESKAEFKADDAHPMVSLAQMLAPSPDWFTGVSSVALKRDGRWIDGESMALYAWDSGTNHATTYQAARIAVEPFVATSLNRAPMFVRDGNAVPVGKVTIRKLREE